LKYEKITNTLRISKEFMKDFVNDGDIVVDATLGNGKDTLDLCKLVGSSGRVYGFDIQELAIENSKKLLMEHGLLDNAILIHDSHENVDKYIDEAIDFAVYNLGYLPNGDKRIITKASSTVASVAKVLDLLKENGIVMIVSYIGHPGGLEEKEALEKFLSQLDQRKYHVLKSEFINQKNSPPLLYLIEKSKTP